MPRQWSDDLYLTFHRYAVINIMCEISRQSVRLSGQMAETWLTFHLQCLALVLKIKCNDVQLAFSNENIFLD